MANDHSPIHPNGLQIGKAMLRAAVFSFVGSLLMVLLFGETASLGTYLFWSVPFIVGLACEAGLAAFWFARLSRWWAYLLAVLLGSIYAGVWSWVPFLFEWWFGERVVRLPPFALLRAVNDSFTAGSTLLPAWIVGGVCGLVGAASAVARERQGPLRKEAPALLVLVVLAVVGAEAVADPSSGFRLRTFTFVKWQPGPSPTIIDDEHNWLSPQEVARLKALNLGGRLKTEGLSIDQGIGLRSYVVIVMQHQVKEPVRLPLTTSRYTIYLQDQNGWHLLPPQPRPGRYAIRLEPWMTSAGDLTGIWVETPSGTGGSTAFNWSPEAP